jgi:predicted DNA-binding transcriptional regulator YafY
VRASRLLAISLLLQARGKMTATQLADELEVSLRTIYRDIDELGAAGVPVFADRGRDGGYSLMDGWEARLDGLTLVEAQSLFLGLLLGPAADLGLAAPAVAARRKAEASLASLGDVGRVSERFHLDPMPWYVHVEPVNHLSVAAEAVWTERRLRIEYSSWRSQSERTIEPLALVFKAGRWYLVAREDGETRMYRVAEIKAASVLGRFRRPRSFNLALWWATRSIEFESSRLSAEATVNVSPKGLVALRRVVEIRDSDLEPDVSGWSRLTIPIESNEHASRMLLALGAEVEVLKPAALRRAMRSTLMELNRLYRVDLKPRNRTGQEP